MGCDWWRSLFMAELILRACPDFHYSVWGVGRRLFTQGFYSSHLWFGQQAVCFEIEGCFEQFAQNTTFFS